MKCAYASILALCIASAACDQRTTRSASDQSTKISEASIPALDLPATARAINEMMRANHYNPAELDSDNYLRIEQATLALADKAETKDEFLEGFRELWKSGPFSHVELNIAHQTADELAAFLDNINAGDDAVSLSWQDETALLTVNTMMGVDTIEAIDAAYETIEQRGAQKLIIDLRNNGGGAFAIRPLISHLISEPIDAGGFVSQPWNNVHDRQPTADDIRAVKPWTGWSIRTFWEEVQSAPITRLQFEPTPPIYSGQTYVLTSQITASAAELVTDAMKSTDHITIVGEKTAGQMLSQKIFDIPGGFHLSLPIADYYSVSTGRIEGVGVSPDINVPADTALTVAKNH